MSKTTKTTAGQPQPVKHPFLRKQPAMRKVMLALVPCILGSIYYFGWRSAAMILFCWVWGFLLEWLFCRKRGEPVSEAVFVTATLFALVMPPGVGWHVLAVGMGFAIIFSKEVFGGFGRNIFNPALAGRCFVYICFPVALTGIWQAPATGTTGALTRWSSAAQYEQTDATTSATPMAHLKAGRLVLGTGGEAADSIPFQVGDQDRIIITRTALLKGQLFGRISGTMGVTSALLIMIGGIYLFITKTANRTTIISVIISYALLNELLFWLNVKPVPGAWPALLGGGFLFGAFFMATDPVSSPKTGPGRIIYGILIGTMTLIIRNFSIFNGGLMFSILLGNMFAPIIDYSVKAWQKNEK